MTFFKILYVEDKLAVREAITELLQTNGHEVLACSCAEAAWDVYAKGAFQLVVTDLSLPGMSGTDLIRRILATQPQQWVILCSGYALPEDLTTFGVNVRSLEKPFEVEDFQAVIDEITSRH